MSVETIEDTPSRAAEASGVPLVLYHGTSQPFERFGPNPAGLFFAENLEKATSYASIRLGPAPRVIQVALNIRRPWTYICYGQDVPYRDHADQSVPTLQALGYDGIHMPEEGVWVAFDPDQVRVLGDIPVEPKHRGGIPAPRFSIAELPASRPGTGDPSRPYDFASDDRFAHLFYGTPTPAEVTAFSNWLRSRPNDFVRLYHGTSASNPIMEEGILATTVSRRNSYQSTSGFVYLSVFPGMAFDFGRYASLNRPAATDGACVAVYPVTMTIRRLVADLDQLHNRRLWAGEQVGNTLAESLVRARGARHRGRVSPTCIGQAERYVDRDVRVQGGHRLGESANLAETVRFSFAGEKARTADLARREQAKALVAAGATATTTHRETGWSMGVDGQWRFEIDDSGAQLLPALKSLKYGPVQACSIQSVSYRVREDGLYDLSLNPPNPQTTKDFVKLHGIRRQVMRELLPEALVMAIDAGDGEEDFVHDLELGKRVFHDFDFGGINVLPLSEVLHHPELFDAYPALRDIPVRVDPRLGNGGSLGERGGGGEMVITIGLGQQLQTLHHEIQHGIQQVEGFARGGSIDKIAEKRSAAIPFTFLDPAIAIVKMAAQQGLSVKEFREVSPRHLRDQPPEAWSMAAARSLESLEREFDFSEIAYDPVGSYHRLAGEVEARNVTTRLSWTAAARKLAPPHVTADVDTERQLVQMGVGDPIMRVDRMRER